MTLTGTVGQFEKVFHTDIKNIKNGSESYFAPVTSLSIDNHNGVFISSIIGLNSWLDQTSVHHFFSEIGSRQALYGSDLQNAYQLDQLYSNINGGYPTNLTIAIIMNSGYDAIQNNTGPFNPSDIETYFDLTLPSNQPRPNVYADPLNSAPLPGIDSKNDVLGYTTENTLDIEMAGSTAPGANIVDVYSPFSGNLTLNLIRLEDCFEEILNPGKS